MAIDAILLDADGVIQTMSTDLHTSMEAALGAGVPVEELMDEIFEKERASLTGQGDFREALQAVLRQANVTVTVDEVLRFWSMIEIVPGMLELVAELRAREYPCFLASNQQRYRARHMSTTLGYAEAFTGEFYSWVLAAMKPDVTFFQAILRELDLDPGSLLFVDDHEPNVEAARELGIRAVRFDARQHAEPAAALRTMIDDQLAIQ